jgi:hypothetical protein
VPLGAAEGDQRVGAIRVVLSPSTGYQSRSPATKTLGSSRKTVSSPPLIVVIHSYWRVFSAISSPSLSGYPTSSCEASRVVVLMVILISPGA